MRLAKCIRHPFQGYATELMSQSFITNMEKLSTADYNWPERQSRAKALTFVCNCVGIGPGEWLLHSWGYLLH